MTERDITEKEAYNRGYDYGQASDHDGYHEFARHLPHPGAYGTDQPDPLSAAYRGWEDGWCDQLRRY